MMKQITTTVCATMLMASCGNISNTEQQVNQRVDELYSRMSQPERIAQLRSGYMDELFDAEGNFTISVRDREFTFNKEDLKKFRLGTGKFVKYEL